MTTQKRNSPVLREKLLKETALLKAKIASLAEKQVRLENKNRLIEAHTDLVNIVNKFHHNAMNYMAVTMNEINEKIDNHPEIAAEWGDWRKSNLSLWAAEHGKGDTNTGEAAESFAVHTVKYEMEARGTTVADAVKDILGAGFVANQLVEYKKAYLRRYILFMKKECADAYDPDAETAEVAFAGFLLRQGEVEHPEVKKWASRIASFEKSLRTVPHMFSKPERDRLEHLARCFQRAFTGNKDKWKQPALDGWLLLVWPLVQAEKWNFQTVHNLAVLKFPDYDEDWKPLVSCDAMGAHCRKDLGLKLIESKGGKPKKDQFDFDNPTPLHRFALQIGDSFPEFSTYSRQTRK